MIYLYNLEEIGANEFKVKGIHYFALDPIDGLKKTEEELLKEGVFVDMMPVPDEIQGKGAVLCYNSETKLAFYKYEDRVMSDKEKIEYLESKLAIVQAALDEILLA